jgi:cytochrome c oxidase assembly protein subunit 15
MKGTGESPAFRFWVRACLAGVLAMVALGGATRLTGSGLSMTEWGLVSGIVPPLTDPAWQELFSLYKATPEYRFVNSMMTPEDFRRIFWLEYLHRLAGRVLGLGVVIPALVWSWRWPGFWRLALKPCSLVLAQGIAGWTMVRSGLVDDPRVAPWRLAVHLVLALWLFFVFLDLARGGPERKTLRGERSATGPGFVLVWMTGTLILGALVAGLDAGLVYNTFPTMNGAWIPDDLLALAPWWRNVYENPATAQWLHRMSALSGLGGLTFLCVRTLCGPALHQGLVVRTLCLGWMQGVLGVVTLLGHVPLVAALLHQSVAFILLGHVQVWWRLSSGPR